MIIRELRQAKHLSQQQLGKASSLDQSQISRIERGIGDIPLSTLIRVAKALEIEPETLVKIYTKAA